MNFTIPAMTAIPTKTCGWIVDSAAGAAAPPLAAMHGGT
jgi:hypothetical protein